MVNTISTVVKDLINFVEQMMHIHFYGPSSSFNSREMAVSFFRSSPSRLEKQFGLKIKNSLVHR